MTGIANSATVPTAMSDWMEIIVPATVASADDVAALLADDIAAARLGLEIRADEVIFWAPLAQYEAVLAEARAVTRQLVTAWGMDVDPDGITARPAVPESEWRDAWKRYFQVTAITRRLTIVPSWQSHEATGEEILLHLDPGQAFGTGAHASTRLLLEELDALASTENRVTRVLDVGTGSGILSIAAARLWPASRALAIDIQDMAVDAARENCERNQVQEQVTCAPTPVAEVTGTFDLVLANIQSSILIDLADDICARIAPGGVALLSGILVAQAQTVANAYVAHAGLDVHAIRRSEHDPEWASVQLRRADNR